MVRCIHFAGWVFAVAAFQVAEPAIPVMWAMAGALIFGLSLALIALLSPHIANRSLARIRSHIEERDRARIEELKSERDKLFFAVDDLKQKMLILKRENDKKGFDLELAYERITELEQRIAELIAKMESANH